MYFIVFIVYNVIIKKKKRRKYSLAFDVWKKHSTKQMLKVTQTIWPVWLFELITIKNNERTKCKYIGKLIAVMKWNDYSRVNYFLCAQKYSRQVVKIFFVLWKVSLLDVVILILLWQVKLLSSVKKESLSLWVAFLGMQQKCHVKMKNIWFQWCFFVPWFILSSKTCCPMRQL